jgi:hypothetical protein
MGSLEAHYRTLLYHIYDFSRILSLLPLSIKVNEDTILMFSGIIQELQTQFLSCPQVSTRSSDASASATYPPAFRSWNMTLVAHVPDLAQIKPMLCSGRESSTFTGRLAWTGESRPSKASDRAQR